MAAIDIDNHTEFHLETVQTMAGKDQSFSDWDSDIIIEHKTQLIELSSYLVALMHGLQNVRLLTK